MKYNRHFEYEVLFAGEYYKFDYLHDARKFLKDKSGYIIWKLSDKKHGIVTRMCIECSNTKNVHFSMED